MNLRSCAWQVVFGSVACVALLGCAFPDGAQEMGLDFWNINRYRTELLEAQARSARLDFISSSARNRIALKAEITENIIGGQMTLTQATERFLELNQSGVDITDVIRLHFPAPTMEESTRLHVLAFVRVRLEEYPSNRREEVKRRIVSEQQAVLARIPVVNPQ